MRFLSCTLVLFWAHSVAAGEKTVPRYVEFRDGSILRFNVIDEAWPITIIRENGAVLDTRVKLSELQTFTLTTDKGFASKRDLLSDVRKLSSEDFWDREKAQRQLLKRGPEIRADLETCLRLTTDLEAETRIKRIMATFPPKASTPDQPPAVNFDLFHLKETCWGHLGDLGIPVLYQGQTHRLSRAEVKSFSAEVPAQLAGLTPARGGPAGVRRLAVNEFPQGSLEEGFERAPDGKALQVGENIQKLYVPRGFLLSTAVANSYVSVNSFTVSGKSRGFSIANHQPLWEGEVSVRFVLPGREDVPAGVTHFGCYIAAVVPKGTALVAEDIQGRELGRVETQSNGHDFVGIASSVPMHRIRIVPDPKLDRDYTLDDFIFTPPQSVEASHPEKYTAYLEKGRAHGRDVLFAREHVQIVGMPGGLPDLKVPRHEVWRINAPERGKLKGKTPWQYFVELRDGSVLAGGASADKQRPEFPQRPNLLQDPQQVTGLWARGSPRLLPGATLNLPAVWNSDFKKWQEVQNVRFLDEAVEWKVGDKVHSAPYTSPTLSIWLAMPREPAPGTWLVHTKMGDEQLVLDPKAPLTGSWSANLETRWQAQVLRLPGHEVRAVSRIGDKETPKQPGPKNMER